MMGLQNIDVYAKMEMLNPFGSVKDRVAKALLDEVLDQAKKKKQTIVEASSGNTAKALAALCGVEGLNFKTVTNRIKQPEVRQMLQTLDADIDELPGISDCPDPNDPDDFTVIAGNLAKKNPNEFYYTDQYFNPENLHAHYRTTGKEILDDLKQVDFYFGFLGTCGSSMGVGQYLLDHGQYTEIRGVVTDSGHYIPGGRTQSELWEVGLFKKEFFKEILACNEQEAIDGMLALNRQCGILCGPTAGATFHATLKKLKEMDGQSAFRKTAVFIVCDRLEPYMSYIQQYRPELFDKRNAGIRPHLMRVAELTSENLELADQISPEALKKKIDAGSSNLKLVDMRGNYAYKRGHIAGSINIFEEVLTPLIEEGAIFGPNDEVVICCPQGTHSVKYAAFLIKQGIRASSLKGGLVAWRNAGYSFIQASTS
jgi:cysteine synthase B